MPRRSVIVANPQFAVNPVYQQSQYADFASSNVTRNATNQLNRVGVIQGMGQGMVPQVVEQSKETLKVDIEEIANPPRPEVQDIFPPKRLVVTYRNIPYSHRNLISTSSTSTAWS